MKIPSEFTKPLSNKTNKFHNKNEKDNDVKSNNGLSEEDEEYLKSTVEFLLTTYTKEDLEMKEHPDLDFAIESLFETIPNLTVTLPKFKKWLLYLSLENSQETQISTNGSNSSHSGQKEKRKENIMEFSKINNPYDMKIEMNNKEEELELKKRIINKFAIKSVPIYPDEQPFKPPPVPKDPKVMLRYRDNQIVTTKGERIVVEKEPLTEEMKKTLSENTMLLL